MSDRIIASTALDFNSGVFQDRVERTPGGVAVNGDTAERGGRVLSPTPQLSAGLPETNSLPNAAEGETPLSSEEAEYLPVASVIVGGGRLKSLLRPAHPYFKDEGADIDEFSAYCDAQEGKKLLYPRIHAYTKRNPYKLHQSNAKCAMRAAKKVFKLAERHQGFRVADLTLTCPAAISAYLAGLGTEKGRRTAWAMEGRFWAEVVEAGLVGEGFARRVNLHTWKSEAPVEPHYHFHTLVPSYEQDGLVELAGGLPQPCAGCSQDSCVDYRGNRCPFLDVKEKMEAGAVKVPKLAAREYRRLDTGGWGYWSTAELRIVKALWLSVLLKFAVQHCIDAFPEQNRLNAFYRQRGISGLEALIDCLGACDAGLIDIFVQYFRLETEGKFGKAGFADKIAYNGRHPLEDYAIYTNHRLDAPDPPPFIARYSNKARVFGWWKQIGKLVSKEELQGDEDIDKLSPYNFKPMIRLRSVSVREVLEDSRPLFLMDRVRGKVIEREAAAEDIAWLKAVDVNAKQGDLYGIGGPE